MTRAAAGHRRHLRATVVTRSLVALFLVCQLSACATHRRQSPEVDVLAESLRWHESHARPYSNCECDFPDVHPWAIKQLYGTWADRNSPYLSLDITVLMEGGLNEPACYDVSSLQDGWVKMQPRKRDEDSGLFGNGALDWQGYFQYRCVGKLTKDVYLIELLDNGGGSLTAHAVLTVRLSRQKVLRSTEIEEVAVLSLLGTHYIPQAENPPEDQHSLLQ